MVQRNRIGVILDRVMPVDLALAIGVIGIDVVARLMPHMPNFTPVAASALFAGAVFRTRTLAFVVPLTAMMFSDCVLGFYDWRVMSVVYVALMVPAAFGLLIRYLRASALLFPLALAGSVLFFIATNCAVWMFSGIYAHDATGLIKCYVAALPFFQYTLMGDLFWTVVLFGVFWLGRRAFVTKRAMRFVA
jgi:hypothetical protein